MPQPYQGALAIDGKEIGRPLLAAVEPLCSIPPGTGPLESMNVAGGKSFCWEAESGMVLPGMAVGEDAEASGGRYVGQGPSPIGQPSGIVVWSLAIEKPGRYWLWARVRSGDAGHPLADRGAFSFQAIGERGPSFRRRLGSCGPQALGGGGRSSSRVRSRPLYWSCPKAFAAFSCRPGNPAR